MNEILFHRPFISEIVYGKIIFIVNYGKQMGVLLEFQSSGDSVVANKSN